MFSIRIGKLIDVALCRAVEWGRRWWDGSSSFGRFPAEPPGRDGAADAGLLKEVDAAIASGRFYSRVGEAIEKRFASATQAARVRASVYVATLGLILYNLFLVLDRYVVPDVAALAAWVQLAVVTPLAAAVIVRIARPRTDAAAPTVLVLCMMTIATVALMSASRAPHVDLYACLPVMFALSGNVLLALPFRWACRFTALYHLIVFPAILLHPTLDGPAKVLVLALHNSVAMYSLFGNYRIEAGVRTAYLFNLRESLRSASLAETNVALKSLTGIDSLTRVANRRAFDEYLSRAWLGSVVPVSMLMIDIDHFKQVNDSFGHLAGDRCLASVAGALTECVRSSDRLVARYGGEEFAVILSGVSAADVALVAERLRLAIASLAIPIDMRVAPLKVTASIGCATLTPAPGLTPTGLIAAADAALYRAKQAGRNQVQVAAAPRTSGADVAAGVAC